MYSNGYYPETSSTGTCFHKKKHHRHHHEHSHEENPSRFSSGEGFAPFMNGLPRPAPSNNVFFTLLIIALIFLVKNKSRLYA